MNKGFLEGFHYELNKYLLSTLPPNQKRFEVGYIDNSPSWFCIAFNGWCFAIKKRRPVK